MDEHAPQRRYALREVFNALRWLVRAGAAWRLLPHDFPPWATVYQQTQRWIAAGCFELIAHDLREVLREAEGRGTLWVPQPSAVILDGRTLRSTPESGHRAGYDGHKRTNGAQLHAAVDTLGYLVAARSTAASEQERDQVVARANKVQEVTGASVEKTFVDEGYTGDEPAAAAADHGITLEVIRLPEAKHGFVLLPRRWVVERTFAWLARFRRLAKDDERLPETVVGLHVVAAACLMLHRAMVARGPSP